MKHNRQIASMWWLLKAVLLILFGGLAFAGQSAEWRRQVEADWLLQEEVRGRGRRAGAIETNEDASGGVDGVKDGRWGFHTASEDRPWWQVDLGEVKKLGRVVIYNRCDKGMSKRAARLVLLLSDDGETWRKVYQHDGTDFRGYTDKKPLVVPMKGARGRLLRIRLPGKVYFHLDEVEVYAAQGDKNIAPGRPADQSSVSRWSTRPSVSNAETSLRAGSIRTAVERGRKLAAKLRLAGLDVSPCLEELDRAADAVAAFTPETTPARRKAVYFRARWAVRKLAFSNPLIDFNKLIFVKRVPGSYSHMSDQYYGWWSRPGGGIYLLDGLESDNPDVRCITEDMPEGSFLRPDISWDGERVLFAHCKHYPHVSGLRNKVDKSKLPADSFYDVYEMKLDGTGLRRLTTGRYDDFDARYLPDGDIVFLSTRRGQFIQCGKASATATTRSALPDSYVRCGGGNYRPVAVYTLHVMNADGGGLRAISGFENFEWTPSVSSDGRVLFARWDYVDRYNHSYMSLWSCNPDGTGLQGVYGNFTKNPMCQFEARSIPGSNKLVFTASAHHSITGGSLVLLDPRHGNDDSAPITRLTPEVCFPEVEGWPETYYANPWPLSESFYLTAWSPEPIRKERGANPPDATGIYLYDAFGNLELIHRDPDISSMYPIPVKPRKKPPVHSSNVAWDGPQEGRMLLMDVYRGLLGSLSTKPSRVERGDIKKIRIVCIPPKTQPQMNHPSIGVTREDPGKCVLGTVPVEEDGSAYFRVPSGTAMFFQALDAEGYAVQTMRTAVHVQAGETLSCIGCHEPRSTTPANSTVQAALRPASKISPGPEGSWPLRFDKLVQPVLDEHCVSCHSSKSSDELASKFDLTKRKAYHRLINIGEESLRRHVEANYRRGRSYVGGCAARRSPVLTIIKTDKNHRDVKLDDADLERLVIWMDTYGQRAGSFSPGQERRLAELRKRWTALLKQ